LCDEGVADFQFVGKQIDQLLELLGVETDKVYNTVYVEVKSSSGKEKQYFHLSDAQFAKVQVLCNDLLMIRSKNYRGRIRNCI